MIRSLTFAAAASAALATAAFAQDTPTAQEQLGAAPVDMGLVAGASQETESTPEDRVVVRGRRLDPLTLHEQVQSFVGEIAKPISSNFGIARWSVHKRICVGAMNIEAEAAQFVVNRVSDIITDVGLKAGEAGCEPDIYYIFTEDGAGLATKLADEQPLMFRPFGGAGGTTQGLHALEDFKNSDAPVRWWQITMVVDWGGNVAIELPNQVRSGPPTAAGSNSRLASSTRDEMWRVYVIVDVSKLGAGTSWPELADYLAVVSLAQIDPDSDTSGFDTVLNLFDAPASTSGLTEWDISYLRALYKFDQHRTPRTQPGLLARAMTRDQLGGGEE